MNAYVVKAGDSPASLAAKFAGCPKCSIDLIRANPGKPTVRYPNGYVTFKSLRAGEVLQLPAKWSDGTLDRMPKGYFASLPTADGILGAPPPTNVQLNPVQLSTSVRVNMLQLPPAPGYYTLVLPAGASFDKATIISAGLAFDASTGQLSATVAGVAEIRWLDGGGIYRTSEIIIATENPQIPSAVVTLGPANLTVQVAPFIGKMDILMRPGAQITSVTTCANCSWWTVQNTAKGAQITSTVGAPGFVQVQWTDPTSGPQTSIVMAVTTPIGQQAPPPTSTPSAPPSTKQPPSPPTGTTHPVPGVPIRIPAPPPRTTTPAPAAYPSGGTSTGAVVAGLAVIVAAGAGAWWLWTR